MEKTSLHAALDTVRTPFYWYDMTLLTDTINACNEAAKLYSYHVHYALKANFNEPVLKLISASGMGADCVSGNEVLKAVACGFPADRVVFAGVGKSDWEMETALDLNIFAFNCESLEELQVLNELAAARNKVAKVAIRINPNVNANTHHYITTGLNENKFGVNTSDLEQVAIILRESKNLSFLGLHFHIGSQITDMEVFKNLCIRVNELSAWFEARNLPIQVLNVGGGLGIDYHEPLKNSIPDFKAYFGVFNRYLELKPMQELHFELGRSIVAQSGNLISKVLYIKKGISTNFAIIDAGMTELIRPALYQAWHDIANLTAELQANGSQANGSQANGSQPNGSQANGSQVNGSQADSRLSGAGLSQTGQAESTYDPLNTDIRKPEIYDIVGPICESSDLFRKAVELPETRRGDMLVIRSAGAYGQVMTSGYNLRAAAETVYSH